MLHHGKVVDDPDTLVHLVQQSAGQGFDADLNRIHSGLLHFSKQRQRRGWAQFGENGQIPTQSANAIEDVRGRLLRQGVVGNGQGEHLVFADQVVDFADNVIGRFGAITFPLDVQVAEGTTAEITGAVLSPPPAAPRSLYGQGGEKPVP